MEHRYDIIIIGTGAGGGTLAHALAPTSARILLLERGDFIPREPANWDPAAVWKDLRYRTAEQWLDHGGNQFRPYTHYCVGGNTKFWGSVLYRLRKEDFESVEHADGLSPAWPIDYRTLEPYYDRAERLYHVHGQRGIDPSEAPRGDFPYPPIPHSNEIAETVERLRKEGLHPSPLPLGLIDPGQPDGCILCNTCNSFPCQREAKSDAATCCVRPLADYDNVTLWTNTLARRLLTEPGGRRVEAVDVERDGAPVRVHAPLVIASCGAVNSAALLLRSATDKHPDGLGNSSGLVGTRYMAHLSTMMQGFHPFRRNRTVFQKTVGINDFYLRGPGHPLSPRADPVAGSNTRHHGADRGTPLATAVGLQPVGRAGRRLVGDDRRPAARGQPGHHRLRRSHPAELLSEQPPSPRPARRDHDADPETAGILENHDPLAPGDEHDSSVRHALLRNRPAPIGARLPTAGRTISRICSWSTRRSFHRRRPSIPD